MSNTYQQGQKDAQQNKGPANTQGMHHTQANSYNAGYKQAQQDSSKK